MVNFFRLIRLPNLLVVILTQLLIFYRVILPSVDYHGLTMALSPLDLWMIIGTTVLITAGGYIINDLLDAKSDIINRPGKNKVYEIGVDYVQWAYVLTILLGYGLSLALAMRMGEEKLLWIYPVAVSLLALYSRYIKPIPFAGNLLVALYCAGVPALFGLAERENLRTLFEMNPVEGLSVVRVLSVYCLFAFIATLLRELVKDIEDLKGDREIGRKTIPILFGVDFSRSLGIVFSMLTLGAISVPVLLGWPSFSRPFVMGFILLLAVATLYFAWSILRSRQSSDYGRISAQLKIFLLGGLGLLVFI